MMAASTGRQDSPHEKPKTQSRKTAHPRENARTSFLIWAAIVAVVIFLTLFAPRRPGVPKTIRDIRNAGYVVALVLSLPACCYLAKQLKYNKKDWNDRLNQNAQLLAAALAVTMTVVLVIAQLAVARGMERAISPSLLTLVPELFCFALAISGTLFARGLRDLRLKQVAVVLSSTVTLTCFLGLAPFFWYQRQVISARAVVQSTPDTCAPTLRAVREGIYQPGGSVDTSSDAGVSPIDSASREP